MIIPSYKVANEWACTPYTESFFFDFDLSGTMILFLKLLPKTMVSVFNSVPMKLVFRNPKIEKYSITLYIEDVAQTPFYITKVSKRQFPDLKKLSQYFSKSNIIRIAIFDQMFKCVYTNDIKAVLPSMSIDVWYAEMEKSTVTPCFDFDNPKETEETGYIIRLKNLANTKTFQYTNLQLRNLWGKSPYVISTNLNSDYFCLKNYKEEGQLGYLQEQLLKEFLSNYFKPNEELFWSIRTKNRAELTDFVILENQIVILIESKTDSAFIGYPSKIRSKEKALTTLIHKATVQLCNAKEIITSKRDLIDDEKFLSCCSPRINTIVGVCLISDALLINTVSLEKSLSTFKRKDIPIIISIEALLDMLNKCNSTDQFCKSLMSIYLVSQREEKLPIVTEVNF